MRRGIAFAAFLLGSAAWAADKQDLTITGTIRIAPELAAAIAPGDRLAIKMYHPDEGVEKDLRFWILDDFAFPQDFAIAPTVAMTGKARWNDYVIEVMTDRDRNVLSLVEGELHARTEGLVPLGTRDVVLVLGAPGK